MGKRRLVGVLAMLLVLVAGCGTEDRIVPVAGVAEVDPPVLDFGRVALGSTAVRELVVHNRGRAPLQIKEIAIPGLGEDIEIVNRGKVQIAAEESTVLAVRYTPQAATILERRLDVSVDDRDNSVIGVPLTGIAVQPRISVEPSHVDFGRLELGVTETRRVVLHNEFDMPVDVRLGRRGDVQYSFAPGELVTIPALGSLEIEVSFQPNRVGRADGRVAVIPCSACDEQSVHLTGLGLDQALVVTPAEIDFNYVPVDRSAVREYTITNVGTRVIQVSAVALVGGQQFSLPGVPPAVALEEGEQIRGQISFQPGSKGEAIDTLRIVSDSTRAPTTDVRVRGIGGGPEIKVTVRNGGQCLEYGRPPLGSRPNQYVTISNVGADPEAPPLVVTNIFPVPGTSLLFGSDAELPIEIPTGQHVDVPIWYEPNELSLTQEDEGLIAITSNDGSQPEVHVCAKGGASEAPPCSGIELAPSVVDFGTLDYRRGAALSVKITNKGTTSCILRDLDVAAGSAPVFWTHRVESFVIDPMGWFGWEVYFDPARAAADYGAFTGELEVFTANGAAQRYAVPLVARSADGCLVPEPRYVDFGDDPAGCGTRGDGIVFTNVCAVPVTVSDISLGEPTTPGEFLVVNAPATPFVVAPSDNFSVAVEWTTTTRGINSVPLYVTEDTREGPLMVPLKGELTAEGKVTDRFVQHAPGKSDFLLVVDNSATMREEQVRIYDAVGALVNEAQARGIDYHIAVTTTGIVAPTDPSLPPCPGGANGAEAGRFFPVDGSNPRIVTPATPNGAQVLAENTQVGLCHQQEEGMQAMRLALSEPLRSGENAGFLREDASLAVLFVSEDDDHSGFPVNDYVFFLESLKGRGGARVSAIVDVDDSCRDTSGMAVRYVELVNAIGGTTASICAQDWGGALANIAEDAFTPRTGFVLSQIPDGGAMQVLVDGVESPPGAWTWVAATNSIVFGTPPAIGSRIEVSYNAACQ